MKKVWWKVRTAWKVWRVRSALRALARNCDDLAERLKRVQGTLPPPEQNAEASLFALHARDIRTFLNGSKDTKDTPSP